MLNKCIICASTNFSIILDYKKNKVVTSDNKIINSSFLLQQCKECFHIQKKIDKIFLNNLDYIYKNYQAYALNDGKEEEKLDIDNKSTNRSQIILNNIKTIIPSNGKVLDIGTGTGVFLKEFYKSYKWELYAQDVNENNKNSLYNLKGFKKFFISGEEKLNKNYFDIISAIHVFEHILDKNNFLLEIKSSITNDGFLLLQVPNIDENIFDIFTIDHISHFNKYILNNLLKKYFTYVYFPKEQISREITVIATDYYIDTLNEQNIKNNEQNIKNKITTLISYLNSIDEKIAVFGTSPPALFCAALLDFNIEYFIDENKNKQKKDLYDCKIISPYIANENIKIIFPYSNDMLSTMQKKYPKLNFISIEFLIKNSEE